MFLCNNDQQIINVENEAKIKIQHENIWMLLDIAELKVYLCLT